MNVEEQKRISIEDSPATLRALPASARWLALLFAMTFPCLMAWIYFVVLAKPQAETGATNYLASLTYALSKVIQFGFPLVWVLYIERRRLNLGRTGYRQLGPGLVWGLAIFLLIVVVYFGFMRGGPIVAATPEKVLARM